MLTTYPEGQLSKDFIAIVTVGGKAPDKTEKRPYVSGFRRDAGWGKATETPTILISDNLEFTRDKPARGWPFEITGAEIRTIRNALTRS